MLSERPPCYYSIIRITLFPTYNIAFTLAAKSLFCLSKSNSTTLLPIAVALSITQSSALYKGIYPAQNLFKALIMIYHIFVQSIASQCSIHVHIGAVLLITRDFISVDLSQLVFILIIVNAYFPFLFTQSYEP